MAATTQRKDAAPPAGVDVAEAGIRISDAATRVGVSARTLRYYEELGLLTPSLYTAGGERRYTLDDLAHLQRILELREVLGMNLDEIREFLSLETRLDQLRASYRASKGATSKKARSEQKATLQEAMELNESLAQQINAKLARMDGFRSKLLSDAQRCRELLGELE
jgi:DNA-binding transcriptional MerR regulator